MQGTTIQNLSSAC